MIAGDRVRKLRANLPGQNRCRLETLISQATIGEIRTLAKTLRIPVSRAIENALKSYLEEYERLEAERQRLCEQGAKLFSLKDKSEYSNQILHHNEQVAAYNQQMGKLEGHPASAE